MIHYVVIIFAFLIAAMPATAQDPPALVEYYGDGVHSYYSGDIFEAHRLLTQAVEGGIQDPRAYYFRAMTLLAMGREDEAVADMESGAYLEARAPSGAYAVGRSIHRLQGRNRLLLEKIRRRVRFNVEQERRQEEQLRYEETRRREADVLRRQRGGLIDELVEPAGGARDDGEGPTMPPLDPAGRAAPPAEPQPRQPQVPESTPPVPDPAAGEGPVLPPATDRTEGVQPDAQELPTTPFSADSPAPADGGAEPAPPDELAAPDAVTDAPFGGPATEGPADSGDPAGATGGAPPVQGQPAGAAASMPDASFFRSLGEMIGRGLSGQGPAQPPFAAPPNAGADAPFSGQDDPFGGDEEPFGGQADPFGGDQDPFGTETEQDQTTDQGEADSPFGNQDPFGNDPFGNPDAEAEGADGNGNADGAAPFGASGGDAENEQAGPFESNGNGSPFE